MRAFFYLDNARAPSKSATAPRREGSEVPRGRLRRLRNGVAAHPEPRRQTGTGRSLPHGVLGRFVEKLRCSPFVRKPSPVAHDRVAGGALGPLFLIEDSEEERTVGQSRCVRRLREHGRRSCGTSRVLGRSASTPIDDPACCLAISLLSPEVEPLRPGSRSTPADKRTTERAQPGDQRTIHTVSQSTGSYPHRRSGCFPGDAFIHTPYDEIGPDTTSRSSVLRAIAAKSRSTQSSS